MNLLLHKLLHGVREPRRSKNLIGLATLLIFSALSYQTKAQYSVTTNDAAFMDISTTGTALNLADDGETNITLNFGFQFYDSLYASPTTLRVGNNGGILFDNSTNDLFAGNATLPTTNWPQGIVAHWDDIDSENGNVYWEELGIAPNRILIVQWHDLPHFSGAGATDFIRFQLQLYEGSNDIVFYYDDKTFNNNNNTQFDNGLSATIGLQNSQTVFDQFSFNTDTLGAINSIRYSFTMPPCGITPTITCPGKSGIMVGDADTFSVSPFFCDIDLPTPMINDPCDSVTLLEYRFRDVDSLNNPTGPFSPWVSVPFDPLAPSVNVDLGSGYKRVRWRITYGVNDDTDTCRDFIFIEDDTPPQPFCKTSGNFVLMPDGISVILAVQLDDGSADNCTDQGDLRFSFDPVSPDSNFMFITCDDIGTVTKTLYIYDLSGNISSCNVTFMVSDETPPDAMCTDIDVYLDGNGMYMLSSADSAAITDGTTDACGMITTTFSPNTFTCADIMNSPIDVTVTYTDNASATTNTSTCVASITVLDTVAPVEVCNDIVVYTDMNGEVTLSPADSAAIVAGTMDNCGEFTTTFSNNFFTCTGIVPPFSGSSQSRSVPSVIAGTSFENESTGGIYTDTGDETVDHALMNNAGEAPVNSTINTELTYSAFYYNTRNDVGLTDGDFVGVTSFTGSVGSYTDGVQGYQMSDTDGGMEVTFGSVNLAGLSMASVSLDIWVDDTGYESSDSIRVSVLVDGSTVIDLYAGSDALLEGTTDQWIPLNLDLTGFNTAVLRVYFDVNSGSEAMYMDNIRFEGMAVQPPTGGAMEDITVTYTDGSGNMSSCVSTITIVDTVSPTAICNDITVTLDANGMASITAADIDGGSFDACGDVTVTIDQMDFDCDDISAQSLLLDPDNEDWAAWTTFTTGSADPTPMNFCGSTNGDPLFMYGCTMGWINFGYSGPTPTQFDDTQYVIDDDNPGSGQVNGIHCIVSPVLDLSLGGNELAFDWQHIDIGSATPDSSVAEVYNGSSWDRVWSFGTGDGTGSETGIDLSPYNNSDFQVRLCYDDGGGWTWGSVWDNVKVTAATNPPPVVTLTVEDESGNISTCTASVTVQDTTSPMCMSLPHYTVFLDENGMASLDSNELDDGSTDNCTITSITLDIDEFDCDDVAPPIIIIGPTATGHSGGSRSIPGPSGITVTQTVTDQSGNTSMCTTEVTVFDTTSPVCMTMDTILYLDASGMAMLNDTSLDNGSSDNCGMVTITLDSLNFSCENVGTPLTVTQTVVDASGNMSTCTATVTVLDTTPPMAMCTDIDVYVDGMGMYMLSSTDSSNIVAGTTDNCMDFTTTFSQTTFTCADIDNGVMVMVTYTDGSGNTDTCTSNITVIDTVSPMAVCQNIEVFLDGNGMASITAAEVDGGSTDNCTDVTLSIDVMDFTCADALGGGSVLLLDPDNENYAAWTTMTTSSGNTVPSAGCSTSGDTIFQYGCTAGYSGGAAFPSFFDDTQYVIDDDNAGSGVNGVHCIISPVLDLSNGGIELAFDWEHRNSGSSTSKADVFNGSTWDNVWTSASTDATGQETGIDLTNYTNSDFQVRLCHDDAGAFGWGSAYDNVAVSANAPATGVPVTLTVTDEYGNMSSCVASVIVSDTTSPMCAAMDMTVILDGSGMVTIDSNALDNGSMDNCSIESITLSQTTFTCADAGMVTVTQTVTDASGNETTCDAIVTVVDDEFPVITCRDTVLFANDTMCGFQVEPNYAVSQIPIDTQSIRSTGTQIILGDDNGSGALPIGFSFDFYGNVYTDFYIGSNGFIAFNDVNIGSRFKQTLPNSATPNDIIAFAWEDLDPGNGGQPAENVITYQTIGTTPNQVLIMEFYRVDHWSNGDNVTAQVHLYEGSNVVEIHTVSQPQNQAHTQGLENVDGTKAAWTPGRNNVAWTATNDAYRFTPNVVNANFGNVTATDNCGAAIEAIAGVPADGLFPVGMTTVTYEATDPSGNSVTCMATITVLDTFAPVAVCNDISVYLDNNGDYSLTAADIEALTDGTTDNCMTFTTDVSQTAFDCDDTDTTVVTITFTDMSNNMSSCMANVLVFDTIPPNVACQDINVPLNNMGEATVPVQFLVVGFFDNCTAPGDAVVSYSPTNPDSNIAIIDCSFVVPSPNYVDVPIYFWDEGGNVVECIAGIRADDTSPPDVVCNDITIDLMMADTAMLSAADSAALIAGTTDNCASVLVTTFDPVTFTCQQVGMTIPVDVTVTDPDGNAATCTANVTVTKSAGPTPVCNDITITLDEMGNYTIGAEDSLVIVTGAGPCIDSVTFSQRDFTCADQPNSPVPVTVTYFFNGVSSSCVAGVTVEGGISGIVFVDQDAQGAGTGASWADAFTTLSEALSASEACGLTSEIWVAEGVYSPQDSSGVIPTNPANNTYKMLPGVGIYGGFDGTEALRESRNFLSNLVILNGGGISYHVVTNNNNGLDQTATLDGFTITGGNATGPKVGDKLGGGIYNNNSSPLIANCVFVENDGIFGGGLANRNNDAKILNCFIKENGAAQGGGMFFWQGSTSEVVNCVIAENASSKDGAGVFVNGSTPSLVNVSFTLNIASRTGGAIASINGSTTTVANSILYGDQPNEVISRSSTNSIVFSIVEGGFPGLGNSGVNPQYVDGPGCDLSLNECSPAIDAGNNASNQESGDILGNPRVANAAIDMGAYEYQLPPAEQAIIYVNELAAGNNNGTSWADAYNELSDALTAAKTVTGGPCGATEVWVAQGTYAPIDSAGFVPTNAMQNTFQMVPEVGIYGGFDGTETDREDRDVNGNVTTLDGGGAVLHVIYNNNNGLTGTAVLDGFTITGGAANGSSLDNRHGGGMYNIQVSPVINDCIFTANDGKFGGGMFNRGGAPRVTNCEFRMNTGEIGAGMFNWTGAQTEVVNTIFDRNTASKDGGGMFNNKNAQAQVINCTFSANVALRSGGGIYSAKSAVTTVTNTILWEDSPEELQTDGAGTNNVSYSNVAGGAPGTGNIDSDPVFVNPGSGDLHVFAGSPVVDAGINSAVPSYISEDLDGNQRIQSGTVDMGVYEGATPIRRARDAGIAIGAKLYPNPVIDWLNVEMSGTPGPIEWELRDIRGGAVKRGISILPEFQIDMSTFGAQQYLLILQSGDQVIVKQVIRIRA